MLIVDDDADETARLSSVLGSHFACSTAASGQQALAAIGVDPFDVVISTSALGTPGYDFLDGVLRRSPSTRVVLMGGEATTTELIEAGRRGVHDYIARPIDDLAFARRVDLACHDAGQPPVRLEPPREAPTRVLIGGAPRLVAALDAADRVAQSTSPVLLVGETGTGKDLFAARIHAHGPRRHRPYVVVNAGAIPATLLDSELFGHVVGAFTGATRPRRGLVAEADGGTLFLDEVADLPIELQGRLLRVLEHGTIRAVGADHERQVDVRFIAATQRDLKDAVRAGRFREDLYYRLNVLAIQLPALRERREDMPSLVSYFFQQARAKNPESPVTELGEDARDRLGGGQWPGNVRELQASIERLVVLGKNATVSADDVDLGEAIGAPPSAQAELVSIREMTTRHVESVLAQTHGDKARAAQILGIDVSTLYRWRRRQSS